MILPLLLLLGACEMLAGGGGSALLSESLCFKFIPGRGLEIEESVVSAAVCERTKIRLFSDEDIFDDSETNRERYCEVLMLHRYMKKETIP